MKKRSILPRVVINLRDFCTKSMGHYCDIFLVGVSLMVCVSLHCPIMQNRNFGSVLNPYTQNQATLIGASWKSQL
jgi:hypothetical protein